ncbi:lauroyl acyltransferase [Dokdonia pacifica]|uniref:Lipid A Biosynthesis N-terminal domain-containing protein n=1 Tax=Dokdonia pacifica TaxID=1627892 RepID=A0A238VMC6_9FLAO|nr:lipid-A-disaccharide synthase N-terminal domain-containing protein [Dokdonia pacifica]GGG20020.1 lauroyl acyltransferase [Dokdonia pacifica]SNR35505.1 Lipid A Biosynthesis N-terminal domain-containing protein [Dokdonia pacifica]
MSTWIILSIGFMAQLLFSGRSLLQWVISEKNKKVLTPTLFWQLSLIASFLLFVYGYLRDDFAIMFGQILTYFIYIRNMHLQGSWKKLHKVIRLFILMFPLLVLTYGYNNNVYDINQLFNNSDIPQWLFVLGITSQIIFTLRFVYQWIYSERKKESSLPRGFWLLSLTGAGLILIYAIFRKDPVLLAGHVFGIVMYGRNLFLLNNQI